MASSPFTEPVMLAIVTGLFAVLNTVIALVLKKESKEIKREQSDLREINNQQSVTLDSVHSLVNGNLVRLRAERDEAVAQLEAIRNANTEARPRDDGEATEK